MDKINEIIITESTVIKKPAETNLYYPIMAMREIIFNLNLNHPNIVKIYQLPDFAFQMKRYKPITNVILNTQKFLYQILSQDNHTVFQLIVCPLF